MTTNISASFTPPHANKLTKLLYRQISHAIQKGTDSASIASESRILCWRYLNGILPQRKADSNLMLRNLLGSHLGNGQGASLE